MTTFRAQQYGNCYRKKRQFDVFGDISSPWACVSAVAPIFVQVDCRLGYIHVRGGCLYAASANISLHSTRHVANELRCSVDSPTPHNTFLLVCRLVHRKTWQTIYGTGIIVRTVHITMWHTWDVQVGARLTRIETLARTVCPFTARIDHETKNSGNSRQNKSTAVQVYPASLCR